MRIGIAADHAGFDFKQNSARDLREQGHDVVDFGAKSLVPDDDYPDYIVPLADAVQRGDVQRGLAICGSGVGASIVANKLTGIRAAICHDTYSAHQGVEHDDMNILVLGARIIGEELAKELINAFLNARFTSEPRHLRRLEKIHQIELRSTDTNGPTIR